MISTKLATHIVVCIPHIVCHISGKHLLLYPHDCWFNPHFFPTSLCGVLVFDSVSRLLPLSHNNFVTHHLSHTTLSHIFFHTHNFVTHHLSLRDIHLRFAWQVWHLWHWAGSGGALGRAWSPVTPLNFAWQAWHLATSTFVLPDRRGIWRHPPSRGT